MLLTIDLQNEFHFFYDIQYVVMKFCKSKFFMSRKDFPVLNRLPDDKILAFFKLKTFANDIY